MKSKALPVVGIFFIFAICLMLYSPATVAADNETVVKRNIPYYSEAVLAGADDYQKSQCRLDIFAPTDAERLPVLVWFHGGGLTGGQKDVPKFLKQEQIVLVAVGYRLSPKAKFPDFLEDAAAAVAWAVANIEQHGGDPKNVFVGGYSAGGYLTGMIGMDPRWLEPHDLSPNDLAGLVMLSAQVTTHFHVKELLQIPGPPLRPVVDENAPLYHVSPELPPMILVLGDRKIEWPVRVEENELMAATLRKMGHPHVEFHENPGYDHGTIGNTNGDFAPEAIAQIRDFLVKYGDMPQEKP